YGRWSISARRTPSEAPTTPTARRTPRSWLSITRPGARSTRCNAVPSSDGWALRFDTTNASVADRDDGTARLMYGQRRPSQLPKTRSRRAGPARRNPAHSAGKSRPRTGRMVPATINYPADTDRPAPRRISSPGGELQGQAYIDVRAAPAVAAVARQGEAWRAARSHSQAGMTAGRSGQPLTAPTRCQYRSTRRSPPVSMALMIQVRASAAGR